MLNWSGRRQRANLELFSPIRSLKPAETITIEHRYELTARASRLVGHK